MKPKLENEIFEHLVTCFADAVKIPVTPLLKEEIIGEKSITEVVEFAVESAFPDIISFLDKKKLMIGIKGKLPTGSNKSVQYISYVNSTELGKFEDRKSALAFAVGFCIDKLNN